MRLSQFVSMLFGRVCRKVQGFNLVECLGLFQLCLVEYVEQFGGLVQLSLSQFDFVWQNMQKSSAVQFSAICRECCLVEYVEKFNGLIQLSVLVCFNLVCSNLQKSLMEVPWHHAAVSLKKLKDPVCEIFNVEIEKESFNHPVAHPSQI